MHLGMLAVEFPHSTFEQNLDAIAAVGVTGVQFDMICAVGESMPARIDMTTIDLVRRTFEARGLELSALAGLYNMIHPDIAFRNQGLDGLKRIIEAAAALKCPVVTLCTGSRNLRSMWRGHPDNNLPEAFRDLVAQATPATRFAEAHGVFLGVEPEVSNTIDSAQKALRLMEEVGSPNLKIIMDGANIFHKGELPRMRDILSEAFALLGRHIILAHGKDLDHDGEAGHLPAGKGMLDYPYYMKLLSESGYDGAMILHGLSPADAPGCVAFVEGAAPKGTFGNR